MYNYKKSYNYNEIIEFYKYLLVYFLCFFTSNMYFINGFYVLFSYMRDSILFVPCM